MALIKLILYRIFQFCITAPVIVAATIITGIITIVGSWIGGGRIWGYWPPHIWARICLAVTLVRVRVTGRENISDNTSYVFVANHQGAYDIFAIYGYLNHNFKWMMKKALRKFPVIGASCAAAGHIFVDNSSASAIKSTMAKAESTLANGMSLVVFPEGSRTSDGRIRPFHKGAFQLSMEFKLPVVPVTIDGAYEVLPRTAILPHWGTIQLTIHKPITPPVDEADRLRVMKASFNAVQSALPERLCRK